MPDPILVVEDYDIDFEAASRSLRRAGLPHPILRARDIREALATLESHRPALILLDLNLSGESGAALLEEVKSRPALKAVPVIVWSANEEEHHISRAYRLGANGFIPKRMRPEEQRRDLENLARYWFETVRLPAEAA